MDAVEAVDGRAPPTASWKTLQSGFPTSVHTGCSAHPVAAKISCAVVERIGVVSGFIDSALK